MDKDVNDSEDKIIKFNEKLEELSYSEDETIKVEAQNKQNSKEDNVKVLEFDKEKIDKVLDSFLKEQEKKKEREQKIEERNLKVKKIKKISVIALVTAFVLIIFFVCATTFNKRKGNNLLNSEIKEEYILNYDYSPGIQLKPINDNLAIYNSSDLKIINKDAIEIVNIPFILADWDMKTSKDRIYILDKIEKKIFFISDKGEFISEAKIDNIPHKIYSGENGNLVLHYKSESGVEGINIFNKNGKLLEDINYPKTTIMLIDISKNNDVTVNGMNRVESKISNYVYRYSSKGKLEYTKIFEDVIFVKQYENNGQIAFIDVNKIQFFSKLTKEALGVIESVISAKLISYDEINEKIYILDKRNKLRIIDMQGNIVEEKYFQSDYNRMLVFKGNLILVGDDYIRTNTKEIKFQEKINDTFILGDYFVIVSKNQIKMISNME